MQGKELVETKEHFLMDFPVVSDVRGKLCVLERSTGVPFNIERVYYLYDVSTGSERGGHAHLQLRQLLIPLSGSFSVRVVSRSGSAEYRLSDPSRALYIGSYVWRELIDFSSGAVCLVLASRAYDESDYIRSRDVFDQRMVELS
jgi:hypothetical protein